VVVLSSRTGWTEDHIRHVLPLSRGLAYYHAARLMDGERCRWPGEPSGLARHLSKIRDWCRGLHSTRTPR